MEGDMINLKNFIFSNKILQIEHAINIKKNNPT
jgi:hypothetical protein